MNPTSTTRPHWLTLALAESEEASRQYLAAGGTPREAAHARAACTLRQILALAHDLLVYQSPGTQRSLIRRVLPIWGRLSKIEPMFRPPPRAAA